MTSPCEENFEDRHFDKISRYEALCVSIRENGWHHHLFAIEVGARGYCAYNVRSCFRRLGLNTKETKVVLQTLKKHLQTLKNQLSYPLEVYPVSASQTLKKPCLIPEHDHPSSGFEMSINQSVNPVFPRVTSLYHGKKFRSNTFLASQDISYFVRKLRVG